MNRYINIYLRYNCAGCNINVMRQSACLVITQVTVDSFATAVNWTPVGHESDSVMGQI